jgi:hypothetical protein
LLPGALRETLDAPSWLQLCLISLVKAIRVAWEIPEVSWTRPESSLGGGMSVGVRVNSGDRAVRVQGPFYIRLSTLGSTTVPSGRRTTKYICFSGPSPYLKSRSARTEPDCSEAPGFPGLRPVRGKRSL